MIFSFWKKLASKSDDYQQGYIDGFEDGLLAGLRDSKETCNATSSTKTWEEIYTDSSY